MVTVFLIIVIGIVIQFFIDSRPNSQMNQLAKGIAYAIKESRK